LVGVYFPAVNILTLHLDTSVTAEVAAARVTERGTRADDKAINLTSVNKVGVFIRGGQAKFALTMLFPRENEVGKIRDLTILLSEKTWYHAEKYGGRILGSNLC